VQGDIGELSAMEWLASRGAHVYVPVGHSPDVDLVAVVDGQALRVEVKTSTNVTPTGRWNVMIATRGGNQSWTGLVKYFKPDRCDFLFVHVRDGRRCSFLRLRSRVGRAYTSVDRSTQSSRSKLGGRSCHAKTQD
jgi:hypothetical protein